MRKLRLDTTDLLVTPTASYRPLVMNDDGWVMTRIAEGPDPAELAESFTHTEIREWLKSNEYARYPFYFDPSKALHRLAKSDADCSAMDAEEAARILWREDFCNAVLAIHAKGKAQKAARKGKKIDPNAEPFARLVLTEASIEEHLGEIVSFVNDRIVKRKEPGALKVDGKRKRKIRAYVKQTTRQAAVRAIDPWVDASVQARELQSARPA
jgi:hypothetical protein